MRAIHFDEPGRRRVAVLCGGESHEREISLQSGRAVADGLGARGHEVVCLDPALTPPEAAHFHDVDIAFLALHGRKGEDGEIQSTLDRMNVLYTGSGAEASRLAFSKSASKERLFQRGISTPPYVLVHKFDDLKRTLELALRIGFPLVLKPDAQGSSLGVSLVKSARSCRPRCGIASASTISASWSKPSPARNGPWACSMMSRSRSSRSKRRGSFSTSPPSTKTLRRSTDSNSTCQRMSARQLSKQGGKPQRPLERRAWPASIFVSTNVDVLGSWKSTRSRV